MHPLSKKDFGSAGIVVHFHNGTAPVAGYVVKQLGTTKFKVTDASMTATYVCTLAQTTAAAATLTAGHMTILRGGEHVSQITARKLKTTEGNTYKWSLADLQS